MNVYQALYSLIKNHVLKIVVALCLISTLCILLVKINLSLSYLPDISGSERSSTFGIQLVADKLPLYPNPEQLPFTIVQYSPLYFYLVGFIYRITGWDSENIYRIQLVSRFVSFGLVILSITTFFSITRRLLNFTLANSLLYCMLIFAILQHWALTNSRIDSLLFLFTSAYLFSILKHFTSSESKKVTYLYLAVLFAVLAFYSKQSGLIHLLVLPAFLVVKQQWFAFLKVALFTVFLIVAFTIGFSYVGSNGSIDQFHANIFGSLAMPMSPGWFYHNAFKHFLSTAGLLVVFSGLICAYWFARSNDQRKQFLSFATLAFLCFATVTTLKHGSGVGYYHEFACTSLLVIFWFFSDRIKDATVKKLSYYAFYGNVLYVMIFLTSRQLEAYTTTNFAGYKIDYINQKKVEAYLRERILPDDKVVILIGDNNKGALLQQMFFKHQLAYQDDVIRFLHISKRRNFDQFFAFEKSNGIKYLVVPDHGPLYFNAFEFTFDTTRYVLQNKINDYSIYATR